MASAGAEVEVGARVNCTGGAGVVRFVGPTSFAPGVWVGVELDEPRGKNDGQVGTARYFTCKPGHGLFLRASQVHATGASESQPPRPPSRLSMPGRAPSVPPVSSPTAGTVTAVAGRRSSNFSPSSSSGSLAALAGAAAPPDAVSPQISRPSSRVSIGQRPPERPSSSGRSSPVASRRGSYSQRVPSSPGLAKPQPSEVGGSSSSGGSGQSSGKNSPPESAKGADVPEVIDLRRPELPLESPARIPPATSGSALFGTPSPAGLARPPPGSPAASTPSKQLVAARVTALQHSTPVPGPLQSEAVLAGERDTGSAAGVASVTSSKEVDELRAKLKLLELKRQDDLGKLRELEDLRASASAAGDVQVRLGDKVAATQAELAELRKQMRDLTRRRDELEGALATAMDDLELVTLDREMAEEKAATLQTELEAMGDRMEELSLNLQVLQEEHEAGIPEGQDSAVVVRQMTRQNERLRDALLRLKESRDETVTELEFKVQILEEDLAASVDAKDKVPQLEADLKQANDTIQELKQTLEAVADVALLEGLNAKNAQLNRKVDEMQKYIDDLEALKDLNEQIEADHVETERDLLEEMEIKDGKMQMQERALAQQELTILDYERTILQFRDLVKALQVEMEDLRNNQAEQAAPSESAEGEARAKQQVVSLTFKLQNMSRKLHEKTLEVQLQQLEANLATENASIMQTYLPEGFFDVEQDPIQSLLMLRRLSFKADLLVQQSRQPSSERPEEDASQEHEFAFLELVFALEWIRGGCDALATYMTNCSAERFVTMFKAQAELSGCERKLDALIDALRAQGEVKPLPVVAEMTRTANQVDHLLYTHLKSCPEHHGAEEDFSRSIQLVALRGIEAHLRTAEVAMGNVNAYSPEFDTVCSNLRTQFSKVLTASRNLARVLREQPRASVPSVSRENIHEFLRELLLVANYLKDLNLALIANPDEEARAEILSQIDRKHFDRVDGRPLNLLLDHVKRLAASMGSCAQNAESTAVLAEKAEGRTMPETPPTAPWLLRGQQFKKTRMQDREELRKTAELQERITRAAAELRLKDEQVRELQVKCQLLESRSASREATAAKVQTSNSRADELARTVDRQRGELEDLNRYVDQLRRQARDLQGSNRDLQQQATRGGGGGGGGGGRGSSGGVFLSMDDHVISHPLAMALAQVRSENARLKCVSLLRQLDSCALPGRHARSEKPAPKPPSRPTSGILSGLENRESGASSESEPSSSEVLRNVTLEVRNLTRRARELASAPKIVDVTGRVSATDPAKAKWRSMATRGDIQLQRERMQARILSRKAQLLQTQLYRVQQQQEAPIGGSVSGAPISQRRPLSVISMAGPTLRARRMSVSSNYSAMSFTTQLAGIDKSPRIAMIRAPALRPSDAGARITCQLSSPAELEKIHSVFVN